MRRPASPSSLSVSSRPDGLRDHVRAPAGGADHRSARAEALGDGDVHVVQHRQAAEQLVDLEGARDAALDPLRLRQRRQVLALEQHRAARGRQDAGEQVDERRLAGAVRPDQRVAGAALEAKVDVARHLERAEVLAQPAGLEERRHQRATAARTRRHSASADPEDPVARIERDCDQHQPDAELPRRGIGLREHVLEHHVRDRADECPVEPAVAAEDQDDQHARRPVQAERGEVHVRVGLREQPARDAGDGSRDAVDDHQPRAHRRTDGVHAQHVLADPGEALPEGRIHQHAHDNEADEQHGERVEVLRPVVQQVEGKQPEDRQELQARHAVEAAGVARGPCSRSPRAAPWCTR